MPHDRYFLDAFFTRGDDFSLEGEEAHHLRVMRGRVGESVTLINGRHQVAHAKLQRVDKKGVYGVITQVESFPAPAPLILAQAIPRVQRVDTIIEKGTELGATAFWFFPGERSEKKSLKTQELVRLKRIAIAAIKQCGRLDLPEILLKAPLLSWPKFPLPTFFGDTHPEAPYLKDLPRQGESCLFIVGPETGFSDQERAYLKERALGVKLHTNILRTETAGFVALALLH